MLHYGSSCKIVQIILAFPLCFDLTINSLRLDMITVRFPFAARNTRVPQWIAASRQDESVVAHHFVKLTTAGKQGVRKLAEVVPTGLIIVMPK